MTPATKEASPGLARPRMGTPGRPLGVRFLEWLTFQQSGGQFQELRGIVTRYPPPDPKVYRKHLPTVFDVPASPVVMVFIIEYLRVAPWPFTRYLEAAVLLKTAFHGQEGWFPKIMPVTTWVARQGGHHLGFPKFVTPSIVLADEGDAVHGRATGFQGERFEADLTFTPDPPRHNDAAPPAHDASLFDGPFHVLKPVGVGPACFKVWFEDVRPPQWRSYPGTVVLQGTNEGLIPAGTQAYPGSLHHFTGGMNLVSGPLCP